MYAGTNNCAAYAEVLYDSNAPRAADALKFANHRLISSYPDESGLKLLTPDERKLVKIVTDGYQSEARVLIQASFAHPEDVFEALNATVIKQDCETTERDDLGVCITYPFRGVDTSQRD